MFFKSISRHQSVLSYVAALIGAFVLAYLLTFGLHQSLNSIFQKIEENEAMHHVQIKIGQDIQTNLYELESLVNSLPFGHSNKWRTTANKHINQRILQIRKGLIVLQNGGEYKIRLPLNLAGQDMTIESYHYRRHNVGYQLAAIELNPMLEKVKEISDQLIDLLAERDRVTSNKLLFDIRKKIILTITKSSSVFQRMHENANQLFFNSQTELDHIEKMKERTKKHFFILENGIAVFTLLIVLGLSYLIFRQIQIILKKQKQAEKALKDNADAQSLLIDSIDAGVILVNPSDHRIIQVNNRASRMFGTDTEKIIGDICYDQICTAKKGECPITDLHQKVENIESEMLNVNGDRIPILKSVRRITLNRQELLLETFVDISDLKKAETHLAEEKKRFEVLSEIAPAFIYRKNRDFVYQSANRDFCELTTTRSSEISGKTDFDLFPEESAKAYRKDDEWVMETGEPIHDRLEEVINADGKLIWGLTNKSPVFDDEGNISGIVGLTMDVTERIKLEEQLQQSQKMESIGRLAGGVAHDFNNMLSVILGYAEISMSDLGPDHPAYKDIEQIKISGQRSTEIVQQLLAFARKQTIEPQVLNLNDTISQMLKMVQRLIGEDIELSWTPEEKIWSIKMDKSQISQILINLCINARDAIQGVGLLTIETGTITFDMEYCSNNPGFIPGDFVFLSVSDNGCGMDSETRNKLFEPFFTTKKQGDGTGLGLATVYGIVKQNNGFINVYSEPEHGSVFKVYFPIHEGSEVLPTTERPEESETGNNELVFIIEDEPAILKITETILTQSGFRVIPALTPSKAIEIIDQQKEQIDLILTDVIMPEMNGTDLIDVLLKKAPEAKVLYMSGYPDNVIKHHGVLDKGMNFIQKPFSKKDLTKKILKILDSRN